MAAHLIGLSLEEARSLVLADAHLHDCETLIVETAPPFVPKFRRPVWGELRVLRARIVEPKILELLVARELLGEEILPKETARA